MTIQAYLANFAAGTGTAMTVMTLVEMLGVIGVALGIYRLLTPTGLAADWLERGAAREHARVSPPRGVSIKDLRKDVRREGGPRRRLRSTSSPAPSSSCWVRRARARRRCCAASRASSDRRRAIIEIDDRIVVGPRTFVAPEKRGLAMVFQDYALWPHLTVRQNVALPSGELIARPRRTVARRVDDLLERVGIGHLARALPQPALGWRAAARGAGARAGRRRGSHPLRRTPVESRRGPSRAAAHRDRDADARASGATAVYITHDQSEAFALADRVGVLNHGRPRPVRHAREHLPASARTPSSRASPASRASSRSSACTACRRRTASRWRCPSRPAQRIEATAAEPAHPSGTPTVSSCAPPASRCTASIGARGVRGHGADVAFNGRGYEHVVQRGRRRDPDQGLLAPTRFERASAVKVCFDPSSCFVMDPSKGRVSVLAGDDSLDRAWSYSSARSSSRARSRWSRRSRSCFAVGHTRGWRSAFEGTGVALVALAGARGASSARRWFTCRSTCCAWWSAACC